jgi:putative flippase GtrA
MWILISFAIIALVLFIIMTLLKIEPLISIVVSVLLGLILSYFIDRITITYTEDPKTKTTATTTAPGLSIQSSNNTASLNSNSAANSFGLKLN